MFGYGRNFDIKIPVIIMVLLISCGFKHLGKKNLNYVSHIELAQSIQGIGYVKSNIIIQERIKNGNYKDLNDLKYRTYGKGIGEKSYEKITQTYRIEDTDGK